MSGMARKWMWGIIAAHALLLLAMSPDYFADNDLGYHVSLARQYGERGAYWWDRLNYAPNGRPNLQGLLLHFSNGVLGSLLGGRGDGYVHGFTILALLQWAAAVFTLLAGGDFGG